MFRFTKNTVIENIGLETSAILKAIKILERDRDKIFGDFFKLESKVQIEVDESFFLDDEEFKISFLDNTVLKVQAKDELGAVYGILFISEKFLNITPFWFFNDQVFEKKDAILIEVKNYYSTPFKVRYRGWFINDEILIDKWTIDGDKDKPWEMIFEALLRLGGNIIIPGTDNNSKKYRRMASDMGLYITHHHSEPLGAEMFSRAYPNLAPSYKEHSELFENLWKTGILSQKDLKIIWNLGFIGQGDKLLWKDYENCKTPKERGKLIGDLIKLQYEYVKNQVKNPICCTNLFGEILELYKDGFIDLPPDIIRIWPDNGYGKMVSKRKNINLRIYALPNQNDKSLNGIYYHASSYDLRASSHITMLSNTAEFIESELKNAFEQGADKFLIVNCSNVKPHVFILDLIAKMWKDGEVDVDKFRQDYVNTYYGEEVEEIIECFKDFANSTINFGKYEDEHAGEQFYNYFVRDLESQWFKGDTINTVPSLEWATGEIPFKEQVIWYKNLCKSSFRKFNQLSNKCRKISEKLSEKKCRFLKDSIWLQVKIHKYCLKGSIMFCDAYFEYEKQNYVKAFYLMSEAISGFDSAVESMKEAEHNVWKGFYYNDCLADIKFTSYCLKGIRQYLRNLDEGPHFYKWQKEFGLLNHLTDDEVFENMKRLNIRI